AVAGGSRLRVAQAPAVWVARARTHALRAGDNAVLAQDAHRLRLPVEDDAMFLRELVLVLDRRHLLLTATVNQMGGFGAEALERDQDAHCGVARPNDRNTTPHVSLVGPSDLGLSDE